jgi:hypothetical protein
MTTSKTASQINGPQVGQVERLEKLHYGFIDEIVMLRDVIRRAKAEFHREGSDKAAACRMLVILDEVQT